MPVVHVNMQITKNFIYNNHLQITKKLVHAFNRYMHHHVRSFNKIQATLY